MVTTTMKPLECYFALNTVPFVPLSPLTRLKNTQTGQSYYSTDLDSLSYVPQFSCFCLPSWMSPSKEVRCDSSAILLTLLADGMATQATPLHTVWSADE